MEVLIYFLRHSSHANINSNYVKRKYFKKQNSYSKVVSFYIFVNLFSGLTAELSYLVTCCLG